MIKDIFGTILYDPLYNGFVFLIDIMPAGDVGLAIIALTLLVRFALLPVMHRSMRAQRKMKELEPKVNELRESHKDDKQEQSKQIMALYQEHGINPFSGCVMFLFQIPVIITLFWIFHNALPEGLSADPLYAFVELPDKLNLMFLGLIDLSEKSLLFAVFAGVTQYAQISLARPPQPAPRKEGETPSLKDEFARSMHLQMKYGFPLFAFFLAYTVFASAIALYWTTSNLFSIAHELLVRRQARQIETGNSES